MKVSDLGLTPNNDGQVIRLSLQPSSPRSGAKNWCAFCITGWKKPASGSAIIRRDQIRDLRDFEKEGLISEDDQERGEKELQELTDKLSEKVENHR